MIAVAQVILNKYLRKPEVTGEWIEEKVRKLIDDLTEYDASSEYYPEAVRYAKDFICSLVEEMPAKKATVSEEMIKKHAVHMSVNAFYDADDHKKGTTPIFEYPRVENALIKFAQEAGLEVKK